MTDFRRPWSCAAVVPSRPVYRDINFLKARGRDMAKYGSMGQKVAYLGQLCEDQTLVEFALLGPFHSWEQLVEGLESSFPADTSGESMPEPEPGVDSVQLGSVARLGDDDELQSLWGDTSTECSVVEPRSLFSHSGGTTASTQTESVSPLPDKQLVGQGKEPAGNEELADDDRLCRGAGASSAVPSEHVFGDGAFAPDQFGEEACSPVSQPVLELADEDRPYPSHDPPSPRQVRNLLPGEEAGQRITKHQLQVVASLMPQHKTAEQAAEQYHRGPAVSKRSTAELAKPLSCITEVRQRGRSRQLYLDASYDKKIYRWKPGSVIKWTINRASFLSTPDAEYALGCLQGALSEWNRAEVGVTFEFVKPGAAGHVVFELRYAEHADFPRGKGKHRVFAMSFFPVDASEGDTCELFIYKFSFQAGYKPHMYNIFLHEAAHILGGRHEDAKDKESGLPSVLYGRPNSKSVLVSNCHPEKLDLTPFDVDYFLGFMRCSEKDEIEGVPIHDIAPS